MLRFAASAQSVSERRIALLKAARVSDERLGHAMQLLSSMLWALKGVTQSVWEITTPDAADVIVVHHDDPDARIPAWRNTGRVIVAITGTRPEHPTHPHTLVFPFRAAEVRALLDRIDLELSSKANSVTVPVLGSPGGGAPWPLLGELKTNSVGEKTENWLALHDGSAPLLWVRQGGVTYQAEPATVLDIRNGSVPFGRLRLAASKTRPEGLAQRPYAELSWFSAYHASEQLAPWLDENAHYRITAWPDLNSIKPAASQIKVVAALAASAAQPNRIPARANVSYEEAVRTLNALAACDVLVESAPARPAPAITRWIPPRPRAGLANFLRSVRKHLGIGG